jgi:hypothetical protein
LVDPHLNGKLTHSPTFSIEQPLIRTGLLNRLEVVPKGILDKLQYQAIIRARGRFVDHTLQLG